MDLNLIDILVGIALIFSIISGFRKGFVYQAASLLSLIGGIYIALNFSSITADFLSKNIQIDPKYIGIISFIVTFIAVIFLVKLLGNFIDKILTVAMMGIVNKLFGIVFSLAKTVLIISIVFNAFELANKKVHFVEDSALANSISYNPIKEAAIMAFPKIKQWHETYLKPELDKLNKKAENKEIKEEKQTNNK